jgi:RNA-binding protein
VSNGIPETLPSSGDSPAPLTGREVRELKSRAQHLQPQLRIGKAGLTAEFVKALDEALGIHGLVKVKFSDNKDRKAEISAEMARATHSALIWRLGHVAVLYRRPHPKSTDASKGNPGA